MPEKASGKTSKTGNLSNVKSVKNNKNTASKKNDMASKKPKALTAKDKPKAKKTEPKETMQALTEDKNKSNEKSVSDLKADKPTSIIAEKISSDLDRKNASYLEPYGEDILFLTDRHRSIVNDVVSCLKSNSPFCFVGSESASYHEYYKEIIIDHIKTKEEIELLYFDQNLAMIYQQL